MGEFRRLSMGYGYGIKCAKCDYGISVIEGIGFSYSPNAVFYGRCDDPTQNWSIALPDGYCEESKPLLLKLVESEGIKEKAFGLLSKGAAPDGYGHALYICPKCNQLKNLFYFKLVSATEQYEPDYHCSKCKTQIQEVGSRKREDGQCELYKDCCKEWNSNIFGELVLMPAYKDCCRVDWHCPECGCEKLIFDWDGLSWD